VDTEVRGGFWNKTRRQKLTIVEHSGEFRIIVGFRASYHPLTALAEVFDATPAVFDKMSGTAVMLASRSFG
jgi:hypothetical protein